MKAHYVRDATATATIFAFFASSWFGWAQASPPSKWRLPLTLAAVGSLLLAVLGATLTWRYWSQGSAFDGAGITRTFGIVVGIEVAVAGLGAGVLIWSGRSELTPTWIALVVGIHLIPLAPLLKYPMLYTAAATVIAVAVSAVPLAHFHEVALSAVTGVGTGAVLLTVACFSLAEVLR